MGDDAGSNPRTSTRPRPWLRDQLGRMRGLEPYEDEPLPPPADPDRPGAPFVVALALLIGESLMANGASAEETAAGMLVTGEAYGLIWCEPDVTRWVLSFSGRMADDECPVTEQRVVRRHTTDFTALGEAYRLVARIGDGLVPVDEARERVRALCPEADGQVLENLRVRWGRAAAHGGIVAASGSVVAGGGTSVVVPSFVAATLGAYISSALAALGVLPFYRYALAAAPAAVFAFGADSLGYGDDSPALIIGGIMALLPTLTMVSAVQDALAGHYLTAYGRIMESVLVFLALVTGTGVILLIGARNGASLPLLPQGTPISPAYASWRLAGTAVFTAAIAYRMRLPVHQWYLVVLLGVGGVVEYVVVRDLGYSRVMATGLAAMTISLICQLLTRRAGTSVLSLAIPAVAPLLPGSVLYRALNELALRQIEHGVGRLIEALALIVTLAAGVSIGVEITYALARLGQRRALRGARPPNATDDPTEDIRTDA
ncbi:threonine/serine exporter ThrE family protein [Streptomyces sp. NPDC050504]|uniref:threonine/serine exporter ThrE family protein n=1 Tax=Streptomyces sp. NPDC050504 TaxID=3365618 RepID=UPI0037B4DDCD